MKRLTAKVAECRAALPRKRGVVLRICVRFIVDGEDGSALGNPNWQVWDGTKRDLAAVLHRTGSGTKARAMKYRFTLAATHRAVAFKDAIAASQNVTDIIREIVPE